MPVLEATQDCQRIVAFKRILMATDLSEASCSAATWAITVARRYGAELYVAHAVAPEVRQFVPMDPLPKEMDREWMAAERKLKSLVDGVRSRHVVGHARLERGRVSEVIASIVEKESIDLLVLGTHGRVGLKKVALGSVAEQVMRTVHCPVLTLGPNVEPVTASALNLRRVLFATDFGPGAAKSLKYALSLAEEYRARLIVLHTICSLPPSSPVGYCPGFCAADELTRWEAEQREVSARQLRELMPPDANLAFEPEYAVLTDFLSDSVLAAAEERNVDLIVMGANETPSARMSAHNPWTVVHSVICGAKCPVLTIMA